MLTHLGYLQMSCTSDPWQTQLAGASRAWWWLPQGHICATSQTHHVSCCTSVVWGKHREAVEFVLCTQLTDLELSLDVRLSTMTTQLCNCVMHNYKCVWVFSSLFTSKCFFYHLERTKTWEVSPIFSKAKEIPRPQCPKLVTAENKLLGRIILLQYCS